MSDAQRKREQGEEDILSIHQDLQIGKSLLTTCSHMTAVRVSVVTGMLTGLYPRSRAKCMVALHAYYHDQQTKQKGQMT